MPGSGKTEFRIASKLQELADNYGEDVAVGIRKFGEAVALNFEVRLCIIAFLKIIKYNEWIFFFFSLLKFQTRTVKNMSLI